MSEPQRLDEVRRELQRLGYLSHRFERFLLQDALAPERGRSGLARLAIKVGLAAGALLAAANAFALSAANRILATTPRDALLLFVHLLLPVTLAVALGFLVAAALFRAVLVAFPRRGLGLIRVTLALAGSAGLLAAGVWIGWDYLRGLPPLGRVAVAAALPLVTAAVAKLMGDGLLALGVLWMRRAPHARLVRRRTVALALAAGIVVVAAAALGLAPPAAEPPPTSLPVASGERVLMIGIDGVLADELDFLLARGDLPNISRLARTGGVIASYARPATASPAELWTTFATGRLPADHGVVALDGYRLLGMASTLTRTGPWRPYLAHVEAPLGLAEQRPLLSNRRLAPTFWELVARGGRPVASINWWGTYPADPMPGLVLAHGAYDLLADPAPGAVAPEARRPALAVLRAEARATTASEVAANALPPSVWQQSLLDRALAPDAFYRAVARQAAPEARALALYLPGADIAADGWRGTRDELAALVRRQLAAADALLGAIAPGFGSIVVVFDPGRRGSDEGRALVWNGSCSAATRPRLDPRQAAAALLRAAGLPQSGELPAPPDFCRWSTPPAVVPTYGQRLARGPAEATGDDYLRTLRALGYL
jgi:hypothetical protein